MPSFTIDSGKGYGPLTVLYKNVLLEFKETKTSSNYGKLWSSIAPSGNIYRYLGLGQERLKHCWDIRRQLVEVAESKKHLLGSEKSQKQRISLLVSALQETTAEGGVDAEADGEVLQGFLPLQEFANDEVGCKRGLGCSFFYPLDSGDFSSWRFNHFLAFLVFSIQTLGVILLLIQEWHEPKNYFKDPKTLWKHLTIKEVFCLGNDLKGGLSTVVGTMFILLIYSIVYNYAKDERENAEKTGRLPTNRFWTIIGNLANAMCSVVVLAAIPIELWGESDGNGITGIMMNSMAMLFVFTLDDLTGDAFGYLATEDNDFAKEISWHFALLSYCPINIRDLINDNATDIKQLWKIKYASNGTLLSTTGEICQTRIVDVTPEPTEDSPLVKEEISDGDMQDVMVEYCISESSTKERLPGTRAQVTKVLWSLVTLVIKIMWVVVPVIWFIVNEPCAA
jgi:hypothetical protein